MLGSLDSDQAAEQVVDEMTSMLKLSSYAQDSPPPASTRHSTMCRYHPESPALFECAGCHKRFCSECVKEVSGAYYCHICRSRLQ